MELRERNLREGARRCRPASCTPALLLKRRFLCTRNGSPRSCGPRSSYDMYLYILYSKAAAPARLSGPLPRLPSFTSFRKQHAAFDIQKRRRHDHELTHDVEVFLLHLMNVFQILVRNLYNGDIVKYLFCFYRSGEEEGPAVLQTPEALLVSPCALFSLRFP